MAEGSPQTNNNIRTNSRTDSHMAVRVARLQLLRSVGSRLRSFSSAVGKTDVSPTEPVAGEDGGKQLAASNLHDSTVTANPEALTRGYSNGDGTTTASRQHSDLKDTPLLTWHWESEVHQMLVVPHTRQIVCGGGVPYAIGVYDVAEQSRQPLARLLCCQPFSNSNVRERLVKKLRGHKRSVEALVLSAEERPELLFSGGADGMLHFWSTSTWKKMGTLEDKQGLSFFKSEDHSYEVHAVAPIDRHTVASSAADYSIKIWDIETERPTITCNIRDELPAVRMVAGIGELLYTGDHLGHVKVWDARAGKQVGAIGGQSSEGNAHFAQVSVLKYDRDRDQLFSGSFDCTVKRWDRPGMAPRTPQCTYAGHKGIVRALEYDAGRVFTCSVNATVRVWDRESGASRGISALYGWPSNIHRFGENQFAVASQDRTLSIWEAFRCPLKPKHPHTCPTAPDVLEATGFNDKTYVVIAGANVHKPTKIKRKKAQQDQLSNIVALVRPTRDPRGEGSRKQKSSLRRSAPPRQNIAVRFEDVDDENKPIDDGPKMDRAKMLQTRDALREAQLLMRPEAQANIRKFAKESPKMGPAVGLAQMLTMQEGDSDDESRSTPTPAGSPLASPDGAQWGAYPAMPPSPVVATPYGVPSDDDDDPFMALPRSAHGHAVVSPTNSCASSPHRKSPMQFSGRFRISFDAEGHQPTKRSSGASLTRVGSGYRARVVESVSATPPAENVDILIEVPTDDDGDGEPAAAGPGGLSKFSSLRGKAGARGLRSAMPAT